MSQLEERVPFLLKSTPAVTTPRAPDAAKFYRKVVELALADGCVTAPEAERLEGIRNDLGIGEDESTQIHRELGWLENAAPAVTMSSDGWPEFGQVLAAAVRDQALERVQSEISLALLDPELDVRRGKLWLQIDSLHGVALWYPDKSASTLEIAIGFYSTRAFRDRQYRLAREKLETEQVNGLADRWTAFERDSDLVGVLALETRAKLAITALGTPAIIEEIATVMSALFDAAVEALSHDDPEPSPDPVVVVNPPVSAPVPEDFLLEPLQGSPRLQESVWLPRILWALEHARREGDGPRSAADIARILQQSGVDVPSTNTARAFRTPHDDPRVTGLCEEPAAQRYVISGKGRRVLFEWLSSLHEPIGA